MVDIQAIAQEGPGSRARSHTGWIKFVNALAPAGGRGSFGRTELLDPSICTAP
jgi:hypothetical protein